MQQGLRVTALGVVAVPNVMLDVTWHGVVVSPA